MDYVCFVAVVAIDTPTPHMLFNCLIECRVSAGIDCCVDALHCWEVI